MPSTSNRPHPDPKLILVRHAWGAEMPLSQFLAKAKAEGYGAIETGIGHLSAAERTDLRTQATAHGLDLIIQIFTNGFAAGPQRTVASDLASFRSQITEALTLHPRLINAHSGFDAWSLAEMRHFYTEVTAIERDLPVPVAHETHRGRCFSSPWVVRELLPALPDLRFTADFSHWCVVAERLIDDQLDLIRAVAAQTGHLHARVGHSQGAQVPDPRDPMWTDAVAAHERWWDLVWDAQAARGLAETTLTPEFGPFPYLAFHPGTTTPVADLAAICLWQANRQRERFHQRQAKGDAS